MRRIYFVCALFLLFVASSHAQTIHTVAGGGPNNMPATSANVLYPWDVAADGAGNFYISATDQHRVFKVDTSGQLTIFAGNASSGFAGDGGPAASASLASPTGVAVDGAGNLFVADRGHSRVRRVDATTNIITTVAGNGVGGFSGDGGPAPSANLLGPSGVAVDSAGNLFIADTYNQRIRRVDAATGVITTVAGNGVAGFSGDGVAATTTNLSYPFGVAVDGAGNLFIGDTINSRVRRVDALTGVITTVAGNGTYGFSGDGGAATGANLTYPFDVSLDGTGNLFMVDTNNGLVRRVDAGTQIITTVASGLYQPHGMAVDGIGNLWIADYYNNRVSRVDASTHIMTTVAGYGGGCYSGDGGAATDASVCSPQDVGKSVV